MMPRHDLAPVVDDEVVRLARRFRKEAVASLVATLRDDRAPASAKASASATLLSYSDGKPGMARQISVADIGQMTPALRQELLHALLVHFQTELPAQFQALLKSAVDDAVAQARLTFAKPKPAKPCRFIRQAPVPEAVPPNMLTLGATAPEPPAADPGEAAIRSDLSGISAVAGGSQPADPIPALQRALIASPTRRGRGPDRAADYDTPYARSLQAENEQRRRRQDAAPTANSPPPAHGPTPADAAVRASNGIDCHGHNGNVVVLPGVTRPPSLTGEYFYDPKTRKLEKAPP
jgi:hypothetical protein